MGREIRWRGVAVCARVRARVRRVRACAVGGGGPLCGCDLFNKVYYFLLIKRLLKLRRRGSRTSASLSAPHIYT